MGTTHYNLQRCYLPFAGPGIDNFSSSTTTPKKLNIKTFYVVCNKKGK